MGSIDFVLASEVLRTLRVVEEAQDLELLVDLAFQTLVPIEHLRVSVVEEVSIYCLVEDQSVDHIDYA